MNFSSKEQAEAMIDWLTANGFDDYSLTDIKKSGDQFIIQVLPQYKHELKAMKKQADIIEIGESKKPSVLQDFLNESIKIQEAKAKTAFDLWAANKAAENRAIKKEIADRERAEREAIKKHNREIAALDRKAVKKKLSDEESWKVFNKVETVIGNTFPDGDPIDHLIPWMEKTGVTMDQINAAVKKHGKAKDMYAYLAGMWDDSQSGAVYDAEMAVKKNEKPQEPSVFFYFDGEKIVKNSNPWK